MCKATSPCAIEDAMIDDNPDVQERHVCDGKHRLLNDDCDECGSEPYVLYEDDTLLCEQCFDGEDRQ